MNLQPRQPELSRNKRKNCDSSGVKSVTHSITQHAGLFYYNCKIKISKYFKKVFGQRNLSGAKTIEISEF